jgi:hypothetical protein
MVLGSSPAEATVYLQFFVCVEVVLYALLLQPLERGGC